MNKPKLSKLYFLATSNAHQLVVDFYESLHNNDGSPVTDVDKVKSMKQSVIVKIRQELDLINAAVEEYNS